VARRKSGANADWLINVLLVTLKSQILVLELFLLSEFVLVQKLSNKWLMSYFILYYLSAYVHGHDHISIHLGWEVYPAILKAT